MRHAIPFILAFSILPALSYAYCSVTLSSSGGGTAIAGFAGNTSTTYLQTTCPALVGIAANPSQGYSFSSWSCTGSGCYSGTNNQSFIDLTGNITETANFVQLPQGQTTTVPSQCSMTVSTNGYGSYSASGPTSVIGGTQQQTMYENCGSSVTISTGEQTFLDWTCTGSGCYSGSSASKTFTLSSNITETANFGQATSTSTSVSTSVSTSASTSVSTSASTSVPYSGSGNTTAATSITITTTTSPTTTNPTTVQQSSPSCGSITLDINGTTTCNGFKVQLVGASSETTSANLTITANAQLYVFAPDGSIGIVLINVGQNTTIPSSKSVLALYLKQATNSSATVQLTTTDVIQQMTTIPLMTTSATTSATTTALTTIPSAASGAANPLSQLWNDITSFFSGLSRL